MLYQVSQNKVDLFEKSPNSIVKAAIKWCSYFDQGSLFKDDEMFVYNGHGVRNNAWRDSYSELYSLSLPRAILLTFFVILKFPTVVCFHSEIYDQTRNFMHQRNCSGKSSLLFKTCLKARQH